jgi:hypothetical protein
MRTLHTLTLCSALGLALAAEAPAQAETRPFLFSAAGPSAGQTNIGLGARFFLFIPTFDLHVVHGLTDFLHFELRGSTLGVVNFLDAGVRMRLLGGDAASLGLRANGSLVAFGFSAGDASTAGVAGGVTPGAFFSFGSSKVQLTLGADLPIFFGGAAVVSGGNSIASGSGSGASLAVRPAVGIEFPVGAGTNLYIQGQFYIVDLTESPKPFGPLISVGASF